MRVGVGAQLLSYPRAAQAGLGRYTRSVIDAMSRVSNGHQLLVFALDSSAQRGVRSSKSLLRRLLWENTSMPSQARQQKVDVFYFTDYGMPLVRPAPIVVITVHDLSCVRYPETFGQARAAYKRILTAASVKRATRIVAPSQSTKRDLVELMGVADDKVAVVAEGVSSHFRPIRDPAVLRALSDKYRLPDRFILYVGTMEPRKNLAALISSMEILKKSYHIEIALVLAGPEGWLMDSHNLAATSVVVRPLGFVDEEDLPVLYSLADALAYPSFYEGFGLPALEAMACGTPVVASKTAALSEVVDEAGMLIDPRLPKDLAEALAAVLTRPLWRAELRAKGLERARQFNWERTASRLWEVIEEVGIDAATI